MSDLHKSDPDSPYADDMEFVRDYARRNDGYALVQPVVDFINAHLDPRIIRTVAELEALDGMTVLMNADEGHPLTLVWHWFDSDGNPWPDSKYDLPAVVVATGEQVRTARKALEEA